MLLTLQLPLPNTQLPSQKCFWTWMEKFVRWTRSLALQQIAKHNFCPPRTLTSLIGILMNFSFSLWIMLSVALFQWTQSKYFNHAAERTSLNWRPATVASSFAVLNFADSRVEIYLETLTWWFDCLKYKMTLIPPQWNKQWQKVLSVL